MQIKIESNLREIAARMKAKQSQIPYAAARSLNDLAFAVRQEIVQKTYPQSFQVKNQRFPGVLFRYEKATKSKLVAEVYDRIEREGKSNSAYLARQESGGSKTSRASQNVAIPARELIGKRNSQGRVPERFRPKNLLSQKGFFKTKTKKGTDVIMGRQYSDVTGKVKRGKAGNLKVYYILKPRAIIGRNFPFYRSAMTLVKRNWLRTFEKHLAAAMRTAR